MLDKLTAEDFRPYLGERFNVVIPGSEEPMQLELADVSILEEDGNGPRREPFSLIFRGPREFYLPQQIYTISHDKMGPLDIFLVPIRPDEHGMRAQAIFN